MSSDARRVTSAHLERCLHADHRSRSAEPARPLRRLTRVVYIIIATALLLAGCSSAYEPVADELTVDLMLKTTPVKDQGQSDLCWAYAMLATIETDRLMTGDSVNLSADYLARVLMERQTVRAYLTQGRSLITSRGTAPLALRLAAEAGLTHYDAYHPRADMHVVSRRLQLAVSRAMTAGRGLSPLSRAVARHLDSTMRPLPRRVYLLGAEYTPEEFARSVAVDGYLALTSVTHHPFGQSVALELPDNYSGETFVNVPIDTLSAVVDRALAAGCAVCWEGDISEVGFSWPDGRAVLPAGTDVSQAARQRAIERLLTTDDHCMTIVGRAHDSAGTPYYICKNSWGTANAHGGYVYMSADYLLMKTIALVVRAECVGGI